MYCVEWGSGVNVIYLFIYVLTSSIKLALYAQCGNKSPCVYSVHQGGLCILPYCIHTQPYDRSVSTYIETPSTSIYCSLNNIKAHTLLSHYLLPIESCYSTPQPPSSLHRFSGLPKRARRFRLHCDGPVRAEDGSRRDGCGGLERDCW